MRLRLHIKSPSDIQAYPREGKEPSSPAASLAISISN